MSKQLLRNAIQKYKDDEIGSKEMDYILDGWIDIIILKVKEMKREMTGANAQDVENNGYNQAIDDILNLIKEK